MTGRCHARSSFHASYKGKNGPQLVVGILESRTKDHPHVFRRLALGNIPTRVEAFPALFLKDTHFLKPSGLDTGTFEYQNSWHIGKRGNVFTQRPSRCNPYVLQFARYYQRILFDGSKSGKATGKGSNQTPLTTADKSAWLVGG
jgi:hypothetical protein